MKNIILINTKINLSIYLFMINEKKVRYYCCEDISLIENYEEAVNDKTLMWNCHHRKEIENGIVRSQGELISSGEYYKVPAKDLIFMTHSDHLKLHYMYKPRTNETNEKIRNTLKGNIPWNKGKTGVYSEDSIKKMSDAAKHRKKVEN